MSTTVDSRVVEMRFDNKQFESNVQTSMSTLDKLKQKLNLNGAAKGLDGISNAAKKVDFSGMGKGIETVNAKFSAMQVIGMTALSNITNSAINAGKRMVSALTIQPITTGFQEYETQINAIQTILANTQKEGTNVEIVNKALDELNTYADKTIYNFTEMTRNIGTFTAAGVKLQTSVNAIQGIANLAAVSGSTSQQASTAMYQLSQALAAGKVQLMDWNSVVNAGMGGQVFQDALIRTSENLKTGAKEAINTYGSFRESLTKSGWLTSEVLTETLNQLAGVYSKSELMAQGYSEKQAEEIVKLADTATAAATEVKTFTQLWDTMKEAAQSGWSQSWRIIVGDFEEAKELLTGISNFFTGDNGLITKMSDARNTLLNSVLGKGFTGLLGRLNEIPDLIDDITEPIDDLTDSFKDLGDIVDRVIMGEFGNVEPRWNELTEMGYNWMRVQNAVNEKLGNSYRYTNEQIEAQDKLINSQKQTAKTTKDTTDETEKLTDAQRDLLKELVHMTDEQLRAKGYTEQQIAVIHELIDTAEKLGIPLDTFIDKLDQINGRWLLWNSFANVGKALTKVFSSIGKAWRDVFDPIDPNKIFDAIAAFHKFTSELILSDEAAENLRKTFRGLFSVLDIFTTVIGGGIKIAFKTLSAVLGVFDMDILSVTGAIGDAIYNFRNWIFEQNILAQAFDRFLDILPVAVDNIQEWVSSLRELPAVDAFATAIEKIAEAFNKIGDADFSLTDLARSLGENLAKALMAIPDMMIQIGKDVIAGFQNGIEAGISGSIIGKIVSFCNEFIAAFAEALGVQSPSWKTYDIAVDTIQGFINGLKAAFGGIVDFVKYIGTQIVNAFKFVGELITDDNGNIDWGRVFALGTLAGIALTVKKVLDIAGGIAGAFEGLGDILNNTGRVMKSFSKVLNGLSWDLKAKAIRNMAISIAILAASVAVLSFIEPAKLWNSVAIIAALAAILVALAFAMDKISQASVSIGKGGAKLDGLKTGLLQIGLAILLLGVTVKMLGSMDPDKLQQGLLGLVGVVIALGVLIASIGGISKLCGDTGVAKMGGTILAVSVAMMLMTGVIKIVSGMSAEDLLKGLVVMEIFVFFVLQMAAANMLAGGAVNKFGGTVLKISIAMLLMTGAIKLIAGMEAEDIIKGLAVMEVFVLFIIQMGVANMIAGGSASKFGGTVLKISMAMVLMVGVMKLISGMEPGEIAKGLVVMELFVLLIAEMLIVAKIGGQSGKLAGTLLAMSASIAILAGVTILLGMMDLGGLAKGITAVGLLSIMMTAMIKALKGAQNVKGAIMMMAVAIGVMAGSVVALSFIKPDKLAGATAAMTILMGMFALIAKTSKNIKTSMTTMGTMIAVVAALAGILYLLSSLKVESTIENATALGVLMLAMSASLKIISGVGSMIGSALKGVLALTAMAIPLLAFVGVLAVASNVEMATGTVMSLIGLMTAMTLLLIPLTIIGNFIASALLGVLSLTAMAVPMLAFIGVLALMNNVENAMANAMILGTFMTVISDVLFKISLVAPLAVVADAAIAGLLVIMAAFGALAIGVGALMDKFPALQSFLDTGIPVLEQLAHAIGSVIGNLIAGFSEALLQILPQFGLALSGFMVGAAPFIAMAGTIDSSVLEGIGYLSGAILALTAANLISGISKFLSFGQDFSDLGTSLSDFINNAKPFLTGIKGIDQGSIESAGMLADLILKLTAADLLDGISNLVSWFTGGSSFADFGEQLSSFGDAVVDFSNTVKGKIDEDSVQAAANAGLAMSELANSIPKSDGFLQDVVGEADLEKFGTTCKAFGQAIKDMSDYLTGENGEVLINQEAVQAAANAGKAMSEVAKAIPKSDGFLQDVVGEQDLEKFGTTCKAFGIAIKDMSKNLTGDNGEVLINQEAVDAAVTAGKAMSEVAKAIPKSDGFLQDVVGEQDLATFGTTCKAFGDAIKTMSDNLTGTGGKVLINEDAINAAVRAGQGMTDVANAIPKEGIFDGKVNLSEFSDYINDFSAAMLDFSADAEGMDSLKMQGAVRAARNLSNFINDIVDLDTSGISKFAGSDYASGNVGTIGTTLSSFYNSVADIDAAKFSSSITFANSLADFISSLSGLDASGIENFKINSIGSAMNSYATDVNDMDVEVVSSSITAANRLKDFIAGLIDLDSSGISNFNLGSLGTTLKSYSTSVTGFDYESVSSSISSATSLKNFIAGLSNLDTSGVGAFVTAINELGAVSIDGIVEAFSGASSEMLTVGSNLIESLTKGVTSKQSTFTEAFTTLTAKAQETISSKAEVFATEGTKLISELISGITSKMSSATNAVSLVVSTASMAIKGHYFSFYNSGSYLGSGLVLGINAKKSAAYNAGYALGQAAVQGEKDGQASNSPSKLTIQAGKWLGEGLVIGINKMGTKVYKAGHDLGDSAASSMSTSISRIADAINTDIDAQPTIRPVLDLDEIKAGAGTIDSLLNIGTAVGVTANLNAIDTMMNRRNQNGANGDVVSAINKLRKDLGNVGNTTYNVNGITYDDGSNITEAVQTLVRAAIMERRI